MLLKKTDVLLFFVCLFFFFFFWFFFFGAFGPTIRMKCQIPFSRKKYLKCRLLNVLPSILSAAIVFVL